MDASYFYDSSVAHAYLGIDCGLSGALVSTYPDGRVETLVMPTLKVKRRGGGTRSVLNDNAILHYLRSCPTFTLCCIEEQISVRNQRVQACFTTAMNYGKLLMALSCARVEYRTVPPREWQAYFSIVNRRKGVVGETTKEQALKVASNLYPDLDMRKSARARKAHDGVVDALLICHYAKETYPKC